MGAKRKKKKQAAVRRAIAYARFSSNNQREESIDAQLRAINDYCDRENIVLVDTFFDEAQSGKFDDRDDFQRMINAVMKGHYEIDAILVHKFNRFARNKYDSAIYKKRLKDIGIRVVSVTQKIDDTPEGDMMESFIEAIDEYYSANLALEVKKGMKENALSGKSTGGKKILGLSVDKEGCFYPDDEAPIVKRIFEMYANGIPKAAIVKTLNEEGLRNQYGRLFNERTLYDLLKNEKYIGNYVYNHSENEVIRLDGVIKNPIIDKETWNKVQQVRQTVNKAKYRERKRYYYLTGKCTCELCGFPISGAGAKKSAKNKISAYYKCSGKTKAHNGCKSTSLNKEYYEKLILEKILQTALTDAAIKEIARQTFEQIARDQKQPTISTEKLKKELQKIKAKEGEITDLLLDGKLSRDVLNVRAERLQKEREAIERNIERNERLSKSSSITSEQIENYLKQAREGLYDLQHSEHDFMKAIFDTFLEQARVNEDEIALIVKVDYSAFTGYTVNFAGAFRTLPPVILKATVKRKRHQQSLKRL